MKLPSGLMKFAAGLMTAFRAGRGGDETPLGLMKSAAGLMTPFRGLGGAVMTPLRAADFS
jgi:hypothetical protein